MTNEEMKSTGMSIMPKHIVATSGVGIALADASFLHDAGYSGITPEQLQGRWADAYLLGRNAVEEALGFPEPYGVGGTYVADAQARNSTPPSQN